MEGEYQAAGITVYLSAKSDYGTASAQECFNAGDISISAKGLAKETEDDACDIADIVVSGAIDKNYVTVKSCYNIGTLSAGKADLISVMLNFSEYEADVNNSNDGYPVLKNCKPRNMSVLLPEDPIGEYENLKNGEYLRLYFSNESNNVPNLLQKTSYTSADGAVKYDGIKRVLTLTNAELASIRANIQDPLTIVISGTCKIGTNGEDRAAAFYNVGYSASAEYTIQGKDSNSRLEVSGDFYINGNLVFLG